MLTPQGVREFGEERNWQAYTNTLKAQHPDLIRHVKKTYPGRKLAESLWLYMNQTHQPTCLACPQPARFRNIKQGYSSTCGQQSCVLTHRLAQSKKVRLLQSQPQEAPTCANPKCSNSVSLLANGMWSQHCSRKCRGQHNSLKSREKAKETWQRTLGVDHPRQCPKINARLQSQWMEKWGVDNPAKAPHAKQRERKPPPQEIPWQGSTASQVQQAVEQFLIEESLPTPESRGVIIRCRDFSKCDPFEHYQEFMDCESQGIQLLSLFSDQWDYRCNVVQETLRAKLRPKRDTLGARECEVREVQNRDLRPLLENHHIQGFATAQHAMGLYHQGQLVAGMSFSPPRLGIGKHANKFQNSWELVRFVSCKPVIGGASRLLSHFVKTHQPVEIFSYSNNDWSNGNLYRQLGFELEHEVAPAYWYIPPHGGIRQHRLRFAKHRLVAEGYDPNLTEREIMAQRGYLRVWDCGKRLWVKVFN